MAEQLHLPVTALVGLTERGVGVSCGLVELEIAMPGASRDEQAALAATLHGGTAAPDSEPGVARVFDDLGAAGLLCWRPDPVDRPAIGAPLADVVSGAPGFGPTIVWTAEEALVVGAGIEVARPLRAFIGGAMPLLRREMYARAAATSGISIWGDLAEPADLARLGRRLPTLDPDLVHVVRLADGATESWAPRDVLAPDPRPGRLGIVRGMRAREIRGRHLGVAEHATPTLEFASHRREERAFGQGSSPASAERLAAIEAVERFACGSQDGRRVRRARAVDLPGAVPADRLIAFSAAQYERHPRLAPFSPRTVLPWVQGATWEERPVWLPADVVFTPYADPVRGTVLADATTSGVAAYRSPEVAARRALLELIERDAYMWTWIQRVSRELIEPETLPGGLRRRVGGIERDGAELRLVNLTLDTKPVVLAALLADWGFGLGLACDDDVERAVEHALDEAIAHFRDDPPDGPLAPEEVRTPADHRGCYGSPARRRHAAFLWAGARRIGLREVQGDPSPVDVAVRTIGEPSFVILTPPGHGPLTVLRAFVPNTVPITFGHDLEPLGVQRALQPIAAWNGHVLGQRLAGPSMASLPHPFA